MVVPTLDGGADGASILIRRGYHMVPAGYMPWPGLCGGKEQQAVLAVAVVHGAHKMA